MWGIGDVEFEDALECDRRASCRLGDRVDRGRVDEQEADLVAAEEDRSHIPDRHTVVTHLLRRRADTRGYLGCDPRAA